MNRRPIPWGMLAPSLGLFVLALLVLATGGCALTPMDRGVVASNAAATVGEQGRQVLHETCTEGYAAANDRPTLERLDAWCIDANKALAAYRAAWLALSAGLAAARAGSDDVATVAHLVQRMADAGAELAMALSRSQEAAR